MALAETKSVIPPLQLRMDSWFEEADLRISANEKPDDEFMASGYQLLFEKLDPYKEADWIQLTEPSLYHIAGLNIRYEPLSDRIPEFSDMFGEMNDHWAIQVFDY